MTVMAPGDAFDLPAMIQQALQLEGPSAIRYPKAAAFELEGHRAPIEYGKAEIVRQGEAGAILCGGGLLTHCVAAADQLAEEGMPLTVVNARFIKPLDRATIFDIIQRSPFVVTVEEAALAGGFGSAVLEACADAGVAAGHVTRQGIPDQYIEHGEREELLADLGLDVAGLIKTCRATASATVA